MPIKSNLSKVLDALHKSELSGLENVGRYWLDAQEPLVPVDTGALKAGAQYEIQDRDKSVRLGYDQSYAVFVELGTVGNRAQPFLAPSILNNVSAYENILGQTIKLRMETDSIYYSDDARVINREAPVTP